MGEMHAKRDQNRQLMVTKENPSLPRFGRFLTQIRKEAGIKSQRQAADMIKRDLASGKKLFPFLDTISNNQVRADERGLISDIPANRLQAYSVLYKVPLSEIVARLVEEKYGVTRTEKIELSVSEIPDIVPAEESEAYRLFRHLLDTKNVQDVLTCLRMISGDPEGNPKRKSVTPEEGHKSKGAA